MPWTFIIATRPTTPYNEAMAQFDAWMTAARTKRAAAFGYQVALVKTPYYYKPAYKPETYLRHYRAVADASPIPILLYSVPVFTGVSLETPEIFGQGQ